MTIDETLSSFLLFIALGLGAFIASTWLGLTLWTWRDIRARTRDTMTHIAATAMVAVLSIVGFVLYLLLRPRETLAEAYERSLEEEALLQGIEEKPQCPGCGRPALAAWQVCPHCYTRLKRPCVKCGQLLELSWGLCPYCAAQQAKGAEGRQRRAVAAPQPPELEEE